LYTCPADRQRNKKIKDGKTGKRDNVHENEVHPGDVNTNDATNHSKKTVNLMFLFNET
jgi:hypothetical protein